MHTNALGDYDRLYKRAKTGKIQYWDVRVIYHMGYAIIRKESGQLGTSCPLVHEETIKEGKNLGKSNETTPAQQADSQADSDWTRKHDEGYKTLKDIHPGHIVGPTADAKPHAWKIYNDIVAGILEEGLPQFNTDASGNIMPMKAPSKPWVAGHKKNVYPIMMEQKLDGLRSLCHITVVDSKPAIKFLSKSGKPWDTVSHLADELTKYFKNQPDGTYLLDGELYYHGWSLQKINRAVKSYKPELTPLMEYWVFDLPRLDMDQLYRTQAVNELVEDVNSEFIQCPVWAQPQNDEDVTIIHDQWVMEGYEGGMLKVMNGKYEPGTRSNYWTKVKMFDDNEFPITGWKLGQRGAEDLVFECDCPDGRFEVKLGGSLESKEQVYQDILINPVRGKMLTVKHFGYTEYGIPNLPTAKAIREVE